MVIKRSISLFLISFLIFATHFILYSPFYLPGKNKKVFYISYGETLKGFFKTLKKNKLINNPEIYRIYSLIYNPDFKPLAGKWEIKIPQNNLLLIKSLNFPLNIETEKEILIPEGLKLSKILLILSRETGIPLEELKKVCYDPNEFKEFFKDYDYIPENLEGYLFPDTYKFPLYLTPKEIIKIMVDRLFEVLKEVGYDTLKDKLELNLHEILTLASIVEKEALYDFEKPRIASVFYNRLKIGMPLQADPTIQYLLEKPLFPLPLKYLKIKSPYNTYINKGLPPAPICSPGKKSIEAVLYPEKTNYLYFVAKSDGTHIFSKSFKEHLKNKKYAKKTWRTLLKFKN